MNKAVYFNDRKAPRMRKAKFSKQVLSKELWTIFKIEHPEYRNLSWKDFQDAWLDIAQTIREELVTNPLGVKLGGYSGELKLQYISKFVATDNITSENLGKKTKFLNIAGRGKVATIKWERRWAVKFNKMLQFFCFEPTRDINNLAKKYIDEFPEKLREARNTLGGYSIWRQLKNKKFD